MEAYTSPSKNFNNSPPERILFLDSLRAVAIIMVVGVHTLGYCLPLPDVQKAFITFLVHTVSVPVFFLVDGYLFAKSASRTKQYHYVESTKKSAMRLLIPWAIFTLAYLAARYLFEFSGLLQETMVIGHSFQDVAISAYGSVYAPQMYFLFSLFLIRLCAPIFRNIVYIESYVLTIFVFLCFVFAYQYSNDYISSLLHIDGGQEPILHALWGVQFYFVGIILHKTSRFIAFEKLFFPTLILFIAALLTHNNLWNIGFLHIQYLYLVTLFLMFSYIGNKLSFLDVIGKNTMGIFLLHTPVVMKGVSLISNEYVSIPIVNFLTILTFSFLIALCLVLLINHIPYGSLLFGEPYKRRLPRHSNNE